MLFLNKYNMGFENLVNRLEKEGKFRDFDRDITLIEKERGTPYTNTLKYLLSVTNELEENGVSDDYALIGGYGVLTHLANSFGRKIIPNWRTSHDLDIVTKNFGIKSVIDGSYEIESRGRSHSIPGKYTYLIKDPKIETPCELDLYIPIYDNTCNSEYEDSQLVKINNRVFGKEFFERSEKKDFYGVNISVPSLKDLISLKLDIGKETRKKDIQDLRDLVAIANIEEINLNKELSENQIKVLYKDILINSVNRKKL